MSFLYFSEPGDIWIVLCWKYLQLHDLGMWSHWISQTKEIQVWLDGRPPLPKEMSCTVVCNTGVCLVDGFFPLNQYQTSLPNSVLPRGAVMLKSPSPRCNVQLTSWPNVVYKDWIFKIWCAYIRYLSSKWPLPCLPGHLHMKVPHLYMQLWVFHTHCVCSIRSGLKTSYSIL